MKKSVIVSLLLLTLSFVLFGCSNGEKLTVDNYEDYLEIEVIYNETLHPGSSTKYKSIKGISGRVNVEGVSSNINYKDCEIVVSINGSYTFSDDAYEPFKNFGIFFKDKPYTIEVPVKLNVAGNGSAEFNCDFDNFFQVEGIEKYYDDLGEDWIKEHSKDSLAFPEKVTVGYYVISTKGRLEN